MKMDSIPSKIEIFAHIHLKKVAYTMTFTFCTLLRDLPQCAAAGKSIRDGSGLATHPSTRPGMTRALGDSGQQLGRIKGDRCALN